MDRKIMKRLEAFIERAKNKAIKNQIKMDFMENSVTLRSQKHWMTAVLELEEGLSESQADQVQEELKKLYASM